MPAGGNTVLVIHCELKMVNGRDGFVQVLDGERRGTEVRRIEGFRMDGQGDLYDLFVLSKELICI